MEIFKIRLIDLQFYARIGVFEQERIVGNNFILNIELDIDSSEFIKENLSTSISYASIYEEVKKIMNKDWLLLETVAVNLKETFLEHWPQILSGRISIVKEAPPISGINGKCGIEYLF